MKIWPSPKSRCPMIIVKPQEADHGFQEQDLPYLFPGAADRVIQLPPSYRLSVMSHRMRLKETEDMKTKGEYLRGAHDLMYRLLMNVLPMQRNLEECWCWKLECYYPSEPVRLLSLPATGAFAGGAFRLFDPKAATTTTTLYSCYKKTLDHDLKISS
jgi:hypothetical protein